MLNVMVMHKYRSNA